MPRRDPNAPPHDDHAGLFDPNPAARFGDGSTPSTIGEVIANKTASLQQVASTKSAAAAADQAYADAQQADASLDAQLKADLAATGPVFVVNQDNSITVWTPDTSDAGYHFFNPAPASTPLPTPTPTPTPTPSPEPAPAPVPSSNPEPSPPTS